MCRTSAKSADDPADPANLLLRWGADESLKANDESGTPQQVIER